MAETIPAHTEALGQSAAEYDFSKPMHGVGLFSSFAVRGLDVIRYPLKQDNAAGQESAAVSATPPEEYAGRLVLLQGGGEASTKAA